MSGIMNMLVAAKTAIAAAIDSYFNLTTLLLPGDGTNGAQNNTFLDSSTNNFSITRNGNTTQGTFSPFSQTGWSNYFNGSADYLGVGANSAFDFGTGNFTVECWFYYASTPPAGSGYDYLWGIGTSASSGIGLYIEGGVPKIWNGSAVLTTSGSISAGTWYHIAVVRNGSGTNNLTVYLNGSSIGSATVTSNLTGGGTSGMNIARWALASDANYFDGYISNLRITKSGALYTSAFTPSTTPLTTTVSAGTVSLLTCQSNRFIDNSTNAFAITVNGTPSVQAFSPFAPTAAYSAATHGGSGYFDGTGDYLSTSTSNSALVFGTSAYTIEFWVYQTARSGTQWVIGGGGGFQVAINSSGNVFGSVAGVGDLTASTGSIPLNAWAHVAIIRSSTSTNGVAYYINGAASGTATDANNYTTNVTLNIGTTNGNSGVSPITGYLSGVRVVKSQALASGAFTIPSAPVTTSAVGWTGANAAGSITGTVSLLTSFTNGGIIDATGKNVLETVGNAQISTTQSKFGGSSMYFDGTGDRLKALYTPNLLFLSGNFTVEMWLYKASNTAYMTACGNISTAVSNAWSVIGDATGNKITWYSNGSFVLTSTTSLSTSTWYHVAIARSGTTIKMFINGTEEASATDSLNYNVTNDVIIGHDNQLISGREWNGYIDDLRITKGYARYTASFTAPTAAFPLS
jgi:hypothetical protein